MLDGESMKKEEVRIKYHGREIYGVSCKPRGLAKYPMVIFSHGYNGNGAAAEGYARYLAERGIGAFYFDFCGGSVHSKSSMATTEMTLFTEKEDLLTVFDAVKKWDSTDREKIFLFGESQGGLVSAIAANELKDQIKGLILVYPAFCIADNWNERFPSVEDIPKEEEFWNMKLGRAFFTSIRDFDVFQHIAGFSGRVLILHGDKDPVVPVKYSEKAAKIYQNASLYVFANEGHGFTKNGEAGAIELSYRMISHL